MCASTKTNDYGQHLVYSSSLTSSVSSLISDEEEEDHSEKQPETNESQEYIEETSESFSPISGSHLCAFMFMYCTWCIVFILDTCLWLYTDIRQGCYGIYHIE